MNYLEVRHYFDAAHQLKDGPNLVTKACAQLHGHTYAVKVKATADTLNSAGMVIDFKAVKQSIDRLDHKYINDVFKEYKIELEPTAENIAYIISVWLKAEYDLNIIRVSVCEGYKGEERASWATYEPPKS